MLFGVIRFISKGWVHDLYILPKHHFGYLGFEWVKVLPDNWMYLPFILMIIAALGIILGAFYRWSALLFFICFTYIELIDKTYYLNHYYFVSLMSFIMILVPANRMFSIDAYRNPAIYSESTTRWSIDLIKFQLAVVYFFAGVAKLHSDWLFEAQPLKIWLQAHHNLPLVGGLLQEDWVAYGFSWMGCIYDLFIVFFLLSNRFRPYAYFFVVFFHVITWYLFPIGIFPWVMIFSTLIFFSASFHRSILTILGSNKSGRFYATTYSFKVPSLLKGFLIIYIILQVAIPFRYVLYPGSLFWNEEGFRFSWRVMLMHKEGHPTFYIQDAETNRISEINNADYLTAQQIDQMATQPDMILQFAQILYQNHNNKKVHYGEYHFTIKDPKVFAEIYVSLNGRPSQLFVDKKHNLAALPYNLKHREWIEPFQD